MLTISKIDPEFKIYKEATTVLFGCGQIGKKTGMMFERCGIPISYFCDNNCQLWGTTFFGVPVISPEELKTLAEKERVVLQMAVNKEIQPDILKQVKEFPLAECIWNEECKSIFSYYHRCELFSSSESLYDYYHNFLLEDAKNKPLLMNYPACYFDESFVFVHMVGKTGDRTIVHTLNQHNVYAFQTHVPDFLPEEFFSGMEKVKIITAVRDSIALDISSIYQGIGLFLGYNLPLEFYQNKEVRVQEFFDTSYGSLNHSEETYGYHPFYNKHGEKNSTLHHWFEEQGKRIVNVLDHPFDQEKGYTIIKEGKYDIFFYQLEKLNDLVPELSEWVGVPFDKLVIANEASSKWVAESYKRAQKELRFSQEYFDRSYDSPYMQHCYSPEDLEKFKARWRNNIDPSL